MSKVLKFETKKAYSILIGLTKTAKNAAIFLLPSLIAYQTTIPLKYAGILSIAIYIIKNYIENK